MSGFHPSCQRVCTAEHGHLGLLAAVSRIAAILPNDLAPTNMNGPNLPFIAGLVAAVQFPQSRPLSLPLHLAMTAATNLRPSGHLLNERTFNKKEALLRVATRSIHVLVRRKDTPKIESVSGEVERCAENYAALDKIADEPAAILGSAIMKPNRAGEATRNKAIYDHVKRIE